MPNNNKKISIPKCMKNNISVKAIDIHTFNQMIKCINKQSVDNDFQILLHTPYGFIKCDICKIAESDNFITATEDIKTNSNKNYKSSNVDFSYLAILRNEQLLKVEKGNPELVSCDNGSVLNLKNVTIYKDNLNNPILNINQMIAFLDQIISFSAIPRNFGENEN